MSFVRPFRRRFLPSPSFLLCLCPLFFRANAILDDDSSPSSPPPSSAHSVTPSGFWLSTELLSVSFHKGCLSTALCHQPAFKLVHTMTLNGQKSAMSWPVDGGGGAELLQDSQLRQFVSHWTVGDPEDVSIACQIAGTDPSFGFARVCDETSARRVFQESMVRRTVMQQQNTNNNNNANIIRAKRKDGANAPAAVRPPSPPSPAAENGQRNYPDQMVVEMRGRCFNATLAVRGHLSRCPWCPDPNVHIHVVGADGGTQQGVDGGNDAQQQQQLNSADSILLLHNIVILALSGAVVFAFTGLCAVFVAQRRHRRMKQHKTTSAGRRESGAKGSAGGGISSTLTMMRGGARREKGKKRTKLLSPPRAQHALPNPQQQQNGEEGGEQQQTMIVYGGGSRRIAGGAEQHEEEERYDTPWDNKYCLVPRQWLFDGESGVCGGTAPTPPTMASQQPADASRAACIAPQFRHHPAVPFQRPSPYDRCPYSYESSSKYATCANFGSAVAQQSRSPMTGMLCSQNGSNRTAPANGNQSPFYGAMPMPIVADHLQQQKMISIGRIAMSDQPSSIGAKITTSAIPDQPPPPPPPIALLPSVRHEQPMLTQQRHYHHQPHEKAENPTFSSPNTSSGSTSRHDDSGLDSV